MPRSINLRQVEAFRAVMENGTVSAAAAALNVTQPAVSKLVSNLELDTGLRLFDRLKGKLTPTAQGAHLYEEVDRVFSGLHQIERAIETVRREQKGRLLVGVLPALSGHFIQHVTMRFLESEAHVFVSLIVRGSPGLADWLVTRQVDVGILNARVEHPDLETEPFLNHPLVCIMPVGHPLARKAVIRPEDLHEQPFVGFDEGVEIRRRVDEVMASHGCEPRLVLKATTAPTLCEFVAHGLGLSLVHPLMAGPVKGRVAIRRFEPAIDNHFLLAKATKARNAGLVDLFIQHARECGDQLMREALIA
ncbi:DNA-binding transcriptional LysR family regulator [Bosea sp. OAE752]|uniref:LysR substrate-binding domain-containing protein n=1 Tax=Bosea sp. OAE752 TaxID=2663873 RepID=UPI00114E2587